MKILISLCALLFTVSGAHAFTQTHLNGPAGSDSFGTKIFVLPNGNFVVTDPDFDLPSPATADVGAVFLYSPEGVLLSTLRGSAVGDRVGSGGVRVLTNGNFVVSSSNWRNGAATSAGAATWGSTVSGFPGGPVAIVSSANSIVGSVASSLVGGTIVALTNGNYAVQSTAWDDGATLNVGAVTWGNGLTGTAGVVSASNSLIGSTANDAVGQVTALPNGNYVVISKDWDNAGAADAGAVTWCNGTTGVSGAVSSANSLVGTTASDAVGSSSLTVLKNGNYVVRSPNWDNAGIVNAGAATWGSGRAGVSGPVSVTNSLVGGSASDSVSLSAVVALTNGNYVVSSASWSNGALTDVGAATWCDGATGGTGLVTAANSLTGATASDAIGLSIVALTNGNYVVVGSTWDNGATADVGAVTWVNGTNGRPRGAASPGVNVTPANSFIGATAGDNIGNHRLVALTNGNYVFISPNWDNGAVTNVGAATLGNGAVGSVGVVSAANSLIGSTTNDFSGSSVFALTNGNYVVSAFAWDNGAGADAGMAAWGNGTTGVKGVVSAANALVGTTAGDQVGTDSFGVFGLPNGNYVVKSMDWDNDAVADVGAVTFANGSTGIKGPVTPTNSLVGTTTSDQVGNGSVTTLTDGSYVVGSSRWSNGAVTNAGAVTLGNGTTGIKGPITPANSLVGSTSNDNLGGLSHVQALPGGRFVLTSDPWDNPAPPLADAFAVTLGGSAGLTGPISTANSVLNTGLTTSIGFDPLFEQLIIGQPDNNRVTIVGNKFSRSFAKTSSNAPGALDISFSKLGSAAIGGGGLIFDANLTGAGSSTGRNRGIFGSDAIGLPGLVLQTGAGVSALGAGLPANAKSLTVSNAILHQPNLGIFTATVSGTGISTGNNQLLLKDSGTQVSVIHRAGSSISTLASASIASIRESLPSHALDQITLSYQLKTSAIPVVNTGNDTGILIVTHNGIINNNSSAREGSPAFGTGGGIFGQFTGRACASLTNDIFFIADYKVGTVTTSAVFSMKADGTSPARVAEGNQPAPGTTLPVVFGAFTGLSQCSGQALFKATLKNAPTAANEGIWQGTTLRIRKGDPVSSLSGITFASLLRFWPGGTDQVIVQTKLTGAGVTAANDEALILEQADGSHLVLLREGDSPIGANGAKVLAFSAVDVNPVNGAYAVLTTMSNTSTRTNQCLWTGSTTAGADTLPLQTLRQPILRLRKGDHYSTDATALGTVLSISLKPALDATGAGGRGLAQCVDADGSVAVFILGDRSLSELVVLNP